MADLSTIPLVALSIETRTLVSTLLNPPKWIPTDDGLPRDWRGLAHLCDLGGETIPSLETHSDPTGRIITIMQDKKPSCMLQDFLTILDKIDRWDVIDDAESLFVRDAEKYLERLERCGTSADEIDVDTEKKALTIDDLYRIRQGLDNQCYDAFLLYSDEDMEFVTEMIENLETKRNLKLCIKDRDLIGGLTFEHEAIMQLISERCNRLIVVVSPNFLKSPANKFFLNYAQAVGIEMRQRKIIPCLYKKCELLPQLKYTFILDYSKGGLYDFWGRLSDSVKVAAVEKASNSNLPTQQSSQHCNGVKSVTDKIGEASKSATNDAMSLDATNLKCSKMNGTVPEPVSLKKLVTPKKSKSLISWPKRTRKTKKSEQDIEPVTETVSLSLPSMDNLPSLDIMESTSSMKSKKGKKNVVGTCVKKVQSLLSKS